MDTPTFHLLKEVEPCFASTAENRKHEGTKTQSPTPRDIFVDAFVTLCLCGCDERHFLPVTRRIEALGGGPQTTRLQSDDLMGGSRPDGPLKGAGLFEELPGGIDDPG